MWYPSACQTVTCNVQQMFERSSIFWTKHGNKNTIIMQYDFFSKTNKICSPYRKWSNQQSQPVNCRQVPRHTAEQRNLTRIDILCGGRQDHGRQRTASRRGVQWDKVGIQQVPGQPVQTAPCYCARKSVHIKPSAKYQWANQKAFIVKLVTSNFQTGQRPMKITGLVPTGPKSESYNSRNY